MGPSRYGAEPTGQLLGSEPSGWATAFKENFLKVLIVHNTYQQPGGEDVVFDQERQMLERAGHQVVTFCRSNWEAEAYSGLRRIALAKRTIWSSGTREGFLSLLRQEKPEVVHVHNTFVMISPSIYSACYEARVPVVQTLHNYRLLCPAATFFRDGQVCEECLQGSLWRSVQHACFHDSRAANAVIVAMLSYHRMRNTWDREISCFIALSEFSRSKFIEGGLPAGKIFVKPNFVYPDPGVCTSERGYALFVGRLSPEKRVSTLLEAWKRCPLSVPMLVIGGGPDRAELEMQAARSGLRQVRFLGQLPRDATLAAIAKARFLVFSSEWYENFPMTIAESFACGTPVIASRMGAMREIVTDGRTGLHFAPGDPEDLARKVEWAWTHPNQMHAIGLEARREYESKYTAEQNYPALMEIYNHAMTRMGDECQ
jgi:glycosyltransferase involved in cell wall biosynthesis